MEETLKALEAARQKLVQLNEAKQVWEAQITQEVAPDRQTKAVSLENDIIQLWGTVKGRTTYKAIFGQEVTLPEITAKYVTIVQRRASQ
ncbi:hypothetical protein [Desulfovirgula thermocuniculi]|uniref:hypothetical protein n=1 Tax=Desulfovirgula thermocuniculi TaxID=348842 RepID=UPI00048496A0|nr:hypothetical protein [Desulfovirgula thermocuniculi]